MPISRATTRFAQLSSCTLNGSGGWGGWERGGLLLRQGLLLELQQCVDKEKAYGAEQCVIGLSLRRKED